jgi:hypothetical protein
MEQILKEIETKVTTEQIEAAAANFVLVKGAGGCSQFNMIAFDQN